MWERLLFSRRTSIIGCGETKWRRATVSVGHREGVYQGWGIRVCGPQLFLLALRVKGLVWEWSTAYLVLHSTYVCRTETLTCQSYLTVAPPTPPERQGTQRAIVLHRLGNILSDRRYHISLDSYLSSESPEIFCFSLPNVAWSVLGCIL